MVAGVRAELEVCRPVGCELAEFETAESIRSVSRTPLDADDTVVTEFVAEASVGGAEKVFDYGGDAVYRLTHEEGRSCACERIEQLGYPVRDHRVENGVVTLSFFVPDIEALRSVVERLTGDGCRVSVRRLTRSGGDTGAEPVFVDRAELTSRQQEVLRTAERMGYFEHPKEANAGEVAAELDISTSTFAEHLAAGQRKLLCAVLG